MRKLYGRWGWDALLILLAATLCLLNFWANGLFHDKLPPADETRYFLFGQALWSGKLQPWDWSPSLAFLYAPFAYAGADPDRAYHLSRALLGSGNVLLAYLAARAVLGRGASFCYSLLIALNAQFLTDYAAHLAGMSVTLAALSCLLRGYGNAGVAVLFLGAFVRPEFILVAVIALTLGLLQPGMLRLDWRRWAWAPMAVAVYAHFFPDLSVTSRQSEAFMEHYAWSMSDLGLWDGSVWSDWQNVVMRDFGALNLSVFEFFRLNPSAFLRHVFHNIAIIPASLADALSIKLFTDTPTRYLGPPLLILAGPIIGWKYRGQTAAVLVTREQTALMDQSLLWIAGFVPIWLLVRPRPSYLHMATPFIVLWVAVRLSKTVEKLRRSEMQ